MLRINDQKIIFLLLVLSFVNLLSCSPKADSQTLKKIVETDAITFTPDNIPQTLIDRLSSCDILILGEMHYVQEHHEFVLQLLRHLHAQGFRQILIEEEHAYEWLMEGYTKGELTGLPTKVTRTSLELLNGIRDLNASLPIEERIKVTCFDMNHRSDAFCMSISSIDKIKGQQKVFRDVLSSSSTSDEYTQAIQTLQNEIESKASLYRQQWGAQWFQRITEMVDIEIRSIPLRKKFDGRIRESIIIELCGKRIGESNGKTVIDCGMNHAQKIHMLGPEIIWLAEHLINHSPITKDQSIISVAFAGIRGVTIQHYYDTDVSKVDVIKTAQSNDLIRILGEHAGDKMSFMPLDDPIFFSHRMPLTYAGIYPHTHSPAQQYDAIITYPHISITKSLDQLSTKP